MTRLVERRSYLKMLALLGLAAEPSKLLAGERQDSTAPALPMPPITIFHLEGRRSERIVWLMEELGLPYTLKFKRGDLKGSMDMIRALSPIVPMAPTVLYGDEVLVESGAIIEMILNRHGSGRLRPALTSKDYPKYLQWMHFAEGSLAARLFMDYRVWQIKPPTERSRLVDTEAVTQFAEEFLSRHPWFGGEAFSGADIMMMWPLIRVTNYNMIDAADIPNIEAWKARLRARPAYQRMLDKSLPDGPIGAPPPLTNRPPKGPRKPPSPA